MSNLYFKMRNGGKATLANGGKAVGPSHNDGGIDAVDKDGNTVAEIEGEERVFSVEHTNEIEEKATEISECTRIPSS